MPAPVHLDLLDLLVRGIRSSLQLPAELRGAFVGGCVVRRVEPGGVANSVFSMAVSPSQSFSLANAARCSGVWFGWSPPYSWSREAKIAQQRRIADMGQAAGDRMKAAARPPIPS